MQAGGTTERGGQGSTLPLAGLRVLVTRARTQAEPTVAALAERGAECVLLPLVEIVPPDDPAPLRGALARLDDYAWAVFTSANAARAVSDELHRAGRDGGAFATTRVCAIGPATAAALRAAGIRVDLVAAEHVGEGVVAALAAAGPLDGLRVLLPRAAAGRDVIPGELRRRGATVDAVVAYRTARPDEAGAAAAAPVLDRLRAGEIHVVLFASPSAVHAFVAAAGSDAAAGAALRSVAVCAIGPATRDAARGHGLEVAVMPGEHTIPALVDALCAHLTHGEGRPWPAPVKGAP
jgi:uroporphyrinogen III methyltransferase / synthase